MQTPETHETSRITDLVRNARLRHLSLEDLYDDGLLIEVHPEPQEVIQ